VSGNKIVLMQDWKTEGDRIKGSFAIAKALAEKLLDVTK
jgi:transcription-repair coupling factor (superfamily II helicase)